MMSSNGVYDIFNARTMTSRQLVDSFIENEAFKELASQNNTILIGPRGSGKTTLMRMLQVEALSIWNSPNGENYRKGLDFTGVFIPTDMVWYRQKEKLLQLSKNKNLIEKYINEIYVIHVLECILQALLFRMSEINGYSYKKVKISLSTEIQLAKDLTELWKLEPNVKTLKQLKNSLAAYELDLIQDCSRILKIEKEDGLEIEFKEINNLVNTSVKIINTTIDEPDGKWCLLFDELELATDCITQSLIMAMRSSHPSIFYKLSLSPFSTNVHTQKGLEYEPMVGQDHTLIKLTNSGDEEFAKKLCQQVFEKKGKIISVEDFANNENFNYKEMFDELSKKDESFASYLNRQKIIVSNFDSYTELNRLPEIRKIRWPVYLRNEIFNQQMRKKSLKRPPDIYGGIYHICQQLEYNPRLIIGTMNKIIPDNKGKASVANQIKALQETGNAFMALLNTMSGPSSDFATQYDFIDRIASAIANKYIYSKEFHGEPKGIFYFSEEPEKGFTKAIGDAINTGAIIIIEDDSIMNRICINEIKGIRFRLSHIFAHKFKIPTIKLHEIEFKKLIVNDVGKIKDIQLELEEYDN